MTEPRCQTLILTLADGRVIRTTVPEFWDGEGDCILKHVEVTEPGPLPAGLSFETIGKPVDPVGPGGMVVIPDPTPRHRTRGGVGVVGRKMRKP